MNYYLLGIKSSVFKKTVDIIRAEVKRVNIGTHSNEIEKELRVHFDSNQWGNILDFPCNLKLRHAHRVTFLIKI